MWDPRTVVDTADEQGGPWTRVVLATNGRTNKWRSYPGVAVKLTANRGSDHAGSQAGRLAGWLATTK